MSLWPDEQPEKRDPFCYFWYVVGDEILHSDVGIIK